MSPGESHIKAQIPDEVQQNAKITVLELKDTSTRSIQKEFSSESHPIRAKNSSVTQDTDDDDEGISPTDGIPLDITPNPPSVPVLTPIIRPIPALTSSFLDAASVGRPFSKPRGKLLLVTPTSLRSGAGNIFGNIFDLNDNFLFIGEPCGRAAAPSELNGKSTSSLACGQLIQRVLACQPTQDDVVTMFRMNPRPRFPQNSGLGRLITQVVGPLVEGVDGNFLRKVGNGTVDVTAAFSGLCQKKIVVVQERFFGGPISDDQTTKLAVPQILFGDASLPIILGVRDVRSMVPSRMSTNDEVDVCGRSMPRIACAEMLCSAVVNIHTTIISRLYGLVSGSTTSQSSQVPKLPAIGNPSMRYLIVKFEDLLEEPRMMAARMLHWAGKATGISMLSTATPRRLDDFLRRTVDESDIQLQTNIRGTEELTSDVDKLKVCRTALVTLAYQIAALNRDKPPYRDPNMMKAQNIYPNNIIAQSWTAICQLQSRVVKDVRGYGGLTSHCQCPGRVSFEECRWRLRNAPQCSALSYGKDGRCCLHDRMGKDFTVGKDLGTRHTVKMLPGTDSCISLPSTKFTALQGRITNMMRRHSLHVRTSLTTTGHLFYMYDGPEFKWRDLITCYRHENHRVAPWEDERWPELAQNTGQVILSPCKR